MYDCTFNGCDAKKMHTDAAPWIHCWFIGCLNAYTLDTKLYRCKKRQIYLFHFSHVLNLHESGRTACPKMPFRLCWHFSRAWAMSMPHLGPIQKGYQTKWPFFEWGWRCTNALAQRHHCNDLVLHSIVRYIGVACSWVDRVSTWLWEWVGEPDQLLSCIYIKMILGDWL